MADEKEVKANLFDAVIKNLFTGSPETGRGLLSPANVADVARAPVDTGKLRGALDVASIMSLNPASVALNSGANLANKTISSGIPQEILGVPKTAQAQKGSMNIGSLFGPNAQSKPADQQQPNVASEDPEKDAKRAEFIKRMIKLGVPLGAAILGSVNPDFLPQTAGFAKGFVGANQRQDAIDRQAGQTKNVIFTDKEGNELGKIEVGKNDRVVVDDGSADAIKDFFDRKFGGGEKSGVKQVNEKTKEVKELSEREERARKALSGAGKDTSDSSVQQLLKDNPNL